MNRRCACVARILGLMLCGGVVSACGQSVLVIEYKGKGAVVQKVERGTPYVKDGEKLVSVPSSARSGLLKVDEFSPVFISVRNVEVRTSQMQMVDSGAELNAEFHFRASFQSPYVLKDVFLVLELETDRQGKLIFYYGGGEMRAGKPTAVAVNVPVSSAISEGKYKLHLFSEGQEVFHSGIPWQVQERALDGMVRRRIAGVKNQGPRPLVGPMPEYPKSLGKNGPAGEATIRVSVTPRGAVTDPVVEAASDPAFGEAALAAVRLWRFLPKLVEGRPVEVKVSVPFRFPAPEKS